MFVFQKLIDLSIFLYDSGLEILIYMHYIYTSSASYTNGFLSNLLSLGYLLLNADWPTNELFHILRIMEFVYTGLCPVSFTFPNRSFPVPSHVTPSDRSSPCALASLSSLKTNRSLDGPYHLSLACWLNQRQKYPQVAQLASTRLTC